jgi:hypothetical protein
VAFTERQEAFLQRIRETGNATQSARDLDIPTGTWGAWNARSGKFRLAYQKAMGYFIESEEVPEGQVPGFLEWRERHCAYLVNGKAHRAENYWFQHEAITAIEKYDNVIMVLPPGHLKTTLAGIEYPTWNIMRDRNFRALIIRANGQVAGDNTAAIGVRLSDHDYYAEMSRRLVEQGEEPISNPITRYGGKDGFQPQGRKMGERWAGNEFTVSGRTSGEKDSTVTAIGMDGAIPGFRADLIVMDDPQDPTKYDASGEEYSKKLMKKFERDISGRLLPGGKTVILANRLGPDDFVGMMIDRYQDDPDWKIIYFPAVIERVDTNRVRREPLCPEVFSLEELDKRRKKVGEDAWAFHYMQENVSLASATFSHQQMDACKDYDRELGEIPHKATHKILGVDPAVTGYCAMVGWGVNPQTGMRYLLDFVNEKGMRNEDNIAQRAVYEAERLGCQTIVVEVRNIQQSIFEKVKDLCRGKGIRVMDYKTATATGAQAQETEFDISSIGKLMDERMVSLPYKLTDHDTTKRMDELIAQFVRWRPRPSGKTSWHLTRDIVMATLFAESQARKFVKSAKRTKGGHYRSDIPQWAKNKAGGWVWHKAG